MHADPAGVGQRGPLTSRAVRLWSFGCAAVVLLLLAGLRMEPIHWGAVGIMSAIGIATSLFSFRLDERTSVTFAPAVFMGAVALFGALVAVWVAAVSSLAFEVLHWRRGGTPAPVSPAIHVIGVVAAAVAYMMTGGVTGPSGLEFTDVGRFLLMFGAFAAVTGGLEELLRERSERGLGRYLRWLSGRGVVVELAMLPLSLLVVASYIPGEPATFPLLAIVLIISSAAGQKLWETQQDLLERVGELRTLNRVGEALSCALRLDDLVRMLHEATREQLEAPVLLVALYDAEHGILEQKVCVANDCELASWSSPLDPSCASEVARTGEPLHIQDLRRSKEATVSPHLAEYAAARGVEIRSWLGAPLMAEGALVGVIALMSDRPKAFDEQTVQLLSTIASHVGKVVENARLYQALDEARRSAEDWGGKLKRMVDERTEELEKARAELEVLNQGLEARVEERTKELRDMQRRIVQSGRLAAVGELSAGVAHELNNPLGGILGYVQYDLEKLQSSEPGTLSEDDHAKLVAHLTLIERETQRCRQIVENLLRFSETSRCASTEVNVNALIEETLGFTGRELASRGIELRTELEDDDLEVMGDPRQLQQVFANIILNARKAMQSGGRLSVRSHRVTGEDGRETVAVSFGDTGCGIPEENLVRVFEPFFTTGEVGDGTGLGLSVSYGIVKDHGGDIDVESKVGVGSTFTVLLPLSSVRTEESCATRGTM